MKVFKSEVRHSLEHYIIIRVEMRKEFHRPSGQSSTVREDTCYEKEGSH